MSHPKSSDLFKIPQGLSPDWQHFFEKVAAYHKRQCATNPAHLMSLERRSRIMKSENLSEWEMIMSAPNMKEKGNDEFRQHNFAHAEMYYLSAITTFPLPDVMNNLAACALKLHRFDVAEEFATKALEIDLLTNPSSIAKAHFRHADARLHLGKFTEALQDGNSAHSLSPNDASIANLLTCICCGSDKIPTA